MLAEVHRVGGEGIGARTGLHHVGCGRKGPRVLCSPTGGGMGDIGDAALLNEQATSEGVLCPLPIVNWSLLDQFINVREVTFSIIAASINEVNGLPNPTKDEFRGKDVNNNVQGLVDTLVVENKRASTTWGINRTGIKGTYFSLDLEVAAPCFVVDPSFHQCQRRDLPLGLGDALHHGPGAGQCENTNCGGMGVICIQRFV
ncbi:hypothetical protein HAX54_000457 [Datura stramonium]|uniref:Uncharacterized protein n=1 Tax=Datura stramonium TaxID=4076 RepID=A0ABS8T139_DATST|nr:hypothetical protein [Datura stramonium]